MSTFRRIAFVLVVVSAALGAALGGWTGLTPIKSANGAPTTVTVTTTGNSASGGNASSIPAGTGGSAGARRAGLLTLRPELRHQWCL